MLEKVPGCSSTTSSRAEAAAKAPALSFWAATLLILLGLSMGTLSIAGRRSPHAVAGGTTIDSGRPPFDVRLFAMVLGVAALVFAVACLLAVVFEWGLTPSDAVGGALVSIVGAYLAQVLILVFRDE